MACAAVNQLPEAFTDPQAVARDLVAEQEVDGAVFRRTRGPILSHSAGDVRPPPRLGENTAELLAELATSVHKDRSVISDQLS